MFCQHCGKYNQHSVWLTPSEFAAKYKVSYQFVCRLIRDRLIEVVRLATRTRVKDVEFEQLSALGVKPNPPTRKNMFIMANRNVEDVFLLRGKEVAQLLGVSCCYVSWLARTGKLKPARWVGVKRHRRYTLAEVRRYLGAIASGSRYPRRSEMSKAVIERARKMLFKTPTDSSSQSSSGTQQPHQ